MSEKCIYQRMLAKFVWALHKIFLLIGGYQIKQARTKPQLEMVYRVRREAYVEKGYLSKTTEIQEFRDEFEELSTTWLLTWRGTGVGTIRVTPLREGKASVFKYVHDFEKILGEQQENSVEIGRLAILKGHRGRFLSITLLLAAYKWSLEKGYTQIVWGGGRWLYYWLQEIVPGVEIKKIMLKREAYEEMEGYFQQNVQAFVYIIPICNVKVLEGVKRLFRR